MSFDPTPHLAKAGALERKALLLLDPHTRGTVAYRQIRVVFLHPFPSFRKRSLKTSGSSQLQIVICKRSRGPRAGHFLSLRL